MSDFVHLHNHSTHSMIDAYGTPVQVLNSAQAKGFKAMALTDHGVLDGLVSFYFEAKKRDIKPILGVEAYICSSINLREAGGVNPIKHVTLLAKSARGYTSLCRLMTAAHSKQGFYFKPRIDWDLLEKEGEDLIVLSGCPSGGVFEDESLLKRLKDRFGKDFYFEVMPVPEPDSYSDKARALWEKAAKLGIKIVMTADCHYPDEKDAKIQDVMLSINTKRDYNDPDRMRMAPIYWQRTLPELNQHARQWLPWLAAPKLFNAAAEATLEIAEKVNIDLGSSIPIRFDCGKRKPLDVLWNLALDGIKKRRLDWNTAYDERFKIEMGLIEEKNFADYFLVVADVVGWAKARGILVGPARGSAAGSLICYLTGITEIDPIPFGLLFERFINHTRYELPDIDLDFEDRHRDTIINYLKAKYGHVGVLSAWSQWKAKSCLLDVARIFNVPQEEIKKVTPLVIQRSGGDARASFTLTDTFAEFPVAAEVLKKYPQLEFASKLEAQVRQKTRHAAGVIISAEPIDKFASRYQDDCLSIDGGQAKKLGALKLDVLGINTLTVIAKALEAIKERHGKVINIYGVDLEDPKVLARFRERKLAGIFQYEGGAMKSVNRRIPVICFNDLVIINAGSRPGPLHCGGTASYIARRAGKEEVTYPHESIRDITQSTLGVTMYQEQVLRIMRDVGDLPWSTVGFVQKIMSSRAGVEAFSKHFEAFKEGAKRKGIGEKDAEEIWNQVYTHGSWSFNMSHAVAYSMLAFWTMWLKVYYPAEFYWASITYTSNEERHHELIKEWKKGGGKLLQVALGKSEALPVLEGDAIRMGWSSIKGIGEKLGECLVLNAPYTSTSDLVSKTRINRPKLELLENLGILERMQLDFFKASQSVDQGLLIKHCPWLFEMDLSQYRDGRCTRLEQIEPSDDRQLQYSLVGVIKEINIRDLNEANARAGAHVNPNDTKTKWANLLVEDEDDTILVTFSRKVYPRFQEKIWKNGGIGNIIKVSGVMMPEHRKLYGSTLDIVGRV